MLISYPVLGVVQTKESPYGGRYPLAVFKDSRHEGLTAGWHGGLHLQVNATTTQGPVVRAIAEGTVVAYRVPTKRPTDPKELAIHPLNYTGGWTDDGFVILKHEKECGEGRPVVFYSLYMHLSSVSIKTSKDKQPGTLQKEPKISNKDGSLSPLPLLRKEVMGHAGSIEGQTNQIHFEIFTSDEDFWKFFKRCQASMDPWGELYFIIPAGQSVYREKPGKGAKAQPSSATPAEMRIALRYRDGDIHFRSLDENGLELEAWPITGGEYAQEDCTGDEYELYGEAGKIDRGKLSRAYELLRFGRFMEWPELANDKKPSPAHCWHFLPMLNGWVDFAHEGVRKHSDADFLEWSWQTVLLGEAGFDPAKGLCQVSQLFSAMDENGEGHLTEIEFGDWSKREENKALLRKLVVQFQSEWDGREPDQRWGWVKEMWANPIKHETAALQNKKAWVEAQKAQAMRSLPVLEQRVLKAKGWRSQIAAKKADAEAALAAAQTSQDEARKAREDFNSDVGGQSTQLAPLTPPKKHQDAVLAKRKGLSKAIDAAIDARKQAEARVKETAPMLAKAEAWVTREETKYRAAQDGIALADPLMADLQKSIEAAAKQTVVPNAASQADKDFDEYKAYMKALQFWEQIPGLPDSKVWHFHPLAFIEFFRKCHWLSKEELALIYPDKDERGNPVCSKEIRETYRVSLNRVMWKYGITTPTRMAHFFGQGWVESGALTAMVEQSSIFPRESTATEEGGYYKNPQNYYYTNVQRYENLSWGGNIDKEDLRDAKGNPVDIKAAVKKSDEDLAAQIVKVKKEKEDASDQLKQLETQKVKDAKAIKALQTCLKGKQAELEDLEKSRKKPNTRHQMVAEETIDASKSRSGDGMKFRGRGMKQLTARTNYTRYWVYRGWLTMQDFDSPWWDSITLKSNGKHAPIIDDPERISLVPFNCIDAGGWFWEAGQGKSINHVIQEGQPAEPGVIRKVSVAINGVNPKTGQPNSHEARILRTQQIAKITLDNVE